MQQIDSLEHASFDCVLKPRIDLSSNTVGDELPVLLECLRAQAGSQVLLDLSENKTIDSQGISAVVGLHKECQNNQRELHVVIKSPLIVKVFQMMQLHRHLNVSCLQ